MAGVSLLEGSILPILHVHWVTPAEHELGLDNVLSANRRDLSLVDCVSFVVNRNLGITTAFTLDPHFAEQGFDVTPTL